MPREVCFAIIRSPCVHVVTWITADTGLNMQVSTVIPGSFPAAGVMIGQQKVGLLSDLPGLFPYFVTGNIWVKMLTSERS